MSVVDLVLIGRNEGARLVAALEAAHGEARRIVYVDSGSTDASVAEAQKRGVEVVELDLSVPFTAARARNAGADALAGDPPDYIQFVDGDCALVPGYMAQAAAFLDGHPEYALVTGWRSEIYRDASVYNQLCDFEWHRPEGDIPTCGGDMMVRWEAFCGVGGFDPTVIAAEDDELCQRLRKAGHKLHRLPLEMTRHDAAMTRLSQFWKRAERTGHGFAQVGHKHPEFFVPERKRAWVYGLVVPLAALLLALVHPLLGLAVLGLYPLNIWRTARGLQAEGLPRDEALRHAGLILLSKFPNLVGLLRYWGRRIAGRQMRLIEYK